MRSEWIRALRFGLPVFLLVAALVLAFAARIQYSHVQDRNHQLPLALDGQSDQVEAAFNRGAPAARSMAFLMEEGAVPARFDSVSGTLLARSTAIDALQLVHQGVITNTFPLEGNEVTIGF